jgi:hypothetical protein
MHGRRQVRAWGAPLRAALAIGLALAWAPAARADTSIDAGTYDTDTWTVAGSPYHVHGSAVYNSLTIEAGTTVLMAQNLGTPIWASQAFTVHGTPSNPVTFDAETPTGSPSWGAIIGEGTVSVTGVIVRNATIGMQLDDDVTVQYARFEGCDIGLSSVRGDLHLDAVYAVGNSIGVENVGAQSLTITNSVFLDNGGKGIEGGTFRTSSVTTIESSTFARNQRALSVAITVGSGSTFVMRNSIVEVNGWGITFIGTTSVSMTVITSDF